MSPIKTSCYSEISQLKQAIRTDQANMGEPANTMHMGVRPRSGRSKGVATEWARRAWPRMICNLTLSFLNLIKLLDKLARLAAPLTMKKMNS